MPGFAFGGSDSLLAPMVALIAWSLVQGTVNHVPTRFAVFTLSTLALVGLTVRAIAGLA